MTKDLAANLANLIRMITLETVLYSCSCRDGNAYEANLHKHQIELLEKAMAKQLESA